MSKTSQDWFTPKNTEKYVGNKKPRYRSSWELNIMMMLDSNPNILKWASESMQIPYYDPIKQRNTFYVPDFFVQYMNKNNKIINEIWEIKPAKFQLLEKVGKNKHNQVQYIKNQAKWQAAQVYCKQHGIVFRVLNENDIFHNPKPKKR